MSVGQLCTCGHDLDWHDVDDQVCVRCLVDGCDCVEYVPAPKLSRQQRRARERAMAKRRERAVTYDAMNPAYIDRGDGGSRIILPHFTSLGPLGVEQCVRANGWAGPVEKARYRHETTERIRGVFG